ncbi:hypothetical protein [Chryseobacterium sp. T1]
MTDIQFIKATKEFFFQYFLAQEMGERPSLLNMEELVEEYKLTILKDNENTNKNRARDVVSNPQDNFGSMPDDGTK